MLVKIKNIASKMLLTIKNIWIKIFSLPLISFGLGIIIFFLLYTGKVQGYISLLLQGYTLNIKYMVFIIILLLIILIMFNTRKIRTSKLSDSNPEFIVFIDIIFFANIRLILIIFYKLFFGNSENIIFQNIDDIIFSLFELGFLYLIIDSIIINLLKVNRGIFWLSAITVYIFLVILGLISIKYWEVISIIGALSVLILDFSFIEAYFKINNISSEYFDENHIKIKIFNLKIFLNACILYLYLLLNLTNETGFGYKEFFVYRFLYKQELDATDIFELFWKGTDRLAITFLLILVIIFCIVLKNRKEEVKYLVEMINSRIVYEFLKVFKKRVEFVANPSVKRDESYNCETRENLKKLSSLFNNKCRLEPIECSNKLPKEGDVFIVQPLKDEYFYGKVLKADINYLDRMSPNYGKSIIVIFNHKYDGTVDDKYDFNYEELIVGPSFVDNSFWGQNLFKVVANEELTEKERNLEYGFFEYFFLKKGGYLLDYRGEYLLDKPKLISSNHVRKNEDIARMIWREFLINPELLDNKYVFTKKVFKKKKQYK